MGGIDDRRKPPKARSVGHRDLMPTLTDPAELEAARVLSTHTSPPPPVGVSEVASVEADPESAAPSSSGLVAYVPVMAIDPERLATLPLDDGAGFVLSLIDGTRSIKALLDVSGMPARQGVALLRELERRGIVVFRSPNAQTGEPAAAQAEPSPTYRVIAEGDDAVGEALTLRAAVSVVDEARARGGRHVAIVDEATSTLLDEADARAALERA